MVGYLFFMVLKKIGCGLLKKYEGSWMLTKCVCDVVVGYFFLWFFFFKKIGCGFLKTVNEIFFAYKINKSMFFS